MQQHWRWRCWHRNPSPLPIPHSRGTCVSLTKEASDFALLLRSYLLQHCGVGDVGMETRERGPTTADNRRAPTRANPTRLRAISTRNRGKLARLKERGVTVWDRVAGAGADLNTGCGRGAS